MTLSHRTVRVIGKRYRKTVGEWERYRKTVGEWGFRDRVQGAGWGTRVPGCGYRGTSLARGGLFPMSKVPLYIISGIRSPESAGYVTKFAP